MKSSTVLSVLAGVFVVFGVVVTANNITWGYIAPYDRLLATDYVIKPSSWFSIQKAEVVYPPKGHISYITLSAIRAIDNGVPKKFGYASLVKGGPGHRNATTHYRSQRGQPLNFTVQYFGH